MADASELHLVTEDHAVEILRNLCGTVAHVVNKEMAARHKARPVSELVTQMAGDMPCQTLSSLNQLHFESLCCLLIIVRSGPVLMLA
jgi:hypothetical protein